MPPRRPLTVQEQIERAMPERRVQDYVEGVLRWRGWLVYHAPDNMPRTSRKGTTYVQNVRAGWPDVFAVRRGRALALELKRETEHPSDAQVEWLFGLRTAGVEVAVLRPSTMHHVETWAHDTLIPAAWPLA